MSFISHTSFCSQRMMAGMVLSGVLPFSGSGMGGSGRERAAPFPINMSVYRTLMSQQLFELHEQAEPKIQLVLGDFRGQISI